MKNFVIIISVCIILVSVGWHYRANIIFEIYPLILEARGYGEKSELSLKEINGCEVGYSDHTEGSYALEIAVAKGAKILEFHFTDSREDKYFRDHKVSLTKSEVLELIQKRISIKK